MQPNLVLIRGLPDGKVEWIRLDGSTRHVSAAPNETYTLIDRAAYEAPKTLVAERVGENLVLEVEGAEAVVIDGFFSTAQVAFYPTTNIAGGAGPFSGTPLTADSPVLAGSTASEQVLWSAEPGESSGDEVESAVQTTSSASGGGTSPMLWVGLGAGALGLAALAGGGGGSGGEESGGGAAVTITSGGTAAAIAESSVVGQVVYRATASTAAGTAATFSLAASGDAAAFTIDGNTGEVRLSGNPNYETKPSYTFTVVATDATNNSASQAVSLAINNLDEVAPSITSSATAAAISENSGAGQIVYTVTSTDTLDISTGSTRYSLKPGGDSAAFGINTTSGAVTLTADPDFEAKPNYNFTVVATDAANNSSELAVTLAVTNVADTPVDITSGGTASAINENSGAAQVVYNTAATAATGSALTYRLKAGDDAAAFTINATSGAVTLTPNPDFEVKSSYLFTVVAADSANNAAEQAVTLAINDVDEDAPAVTGVVLSAAVGAQNGQLNVGDRAQVTVTLNENTVVTGTPRVVLNVGGGPNEFANYVSGSGTTNLLFEYTIQAGDTDSNGIAIPANAVQLNGGSLRDATGNAASLSHSAVSNNGSFIVDTSGPSVSSIALSGAVGAQNGVLNAGDRVQVTVRMTENTVVAGTPNVELNVGANTRLATYVSGSGTTNLIFEYTIQAGDTDTNGISIPANAVELNGATWVDAAGNTANVNHGAVGNNGSFIVDTAPPNLSSIALTNAIGDQNGALNAGDRAQVTVAMSETTVVTGTPTVALDVGSTTRLATYVSGSGSANLVFEYTIQAGETDTNGIAIPVNALQLNGGTLQDVAGHAAANLSNATVASNGSFVVDTTAGGVDSIALSGSVGDQNGLLNTGDRVQVTVTMTENTFVAGTPRVALDIGSGPNDFANYVSGSGTTSLLFEYVIQPGDEDDNGISIPGNALQLNGGTLTDAAGNASSIGHGSVSSNGSFVVDTTAPTLLSSSPADDATDVPRGTDIVLDFSEDVTAGSGNIIIRDIVPGPNLDLTIPINDPQIAISGNQVTVNPSFDLRPGGNYAVRIDDGAITDLAGNAFGGINNNNTLDFETIFDIFGLSEPTQLSSLDSRTFQTAQSNEIDIRVATADATSNVLGSSDASASSLDLSSDARIHLVGDGPSYTSSLLADDGGGSLETTVSDETHFGTSMQGAFGNSEEGHAAALPALEFPVIISTSQGLA